MTNKIMEEDCQCLTMTCNMTCNKKGTSVQRTINRIVIG